MHWSDAAAAVEREEDPDRREAKPSEGGRRRPSTVGQRRHHRPAEGGPRDSGGSGRCGAEVMNSQGALTWMLRGGGICCDPPSVPLPPGAFLLSTTLSTRRCAPRSFVAGAPPESTHRPCLAGAFDSECLGEPAPSGPAPEGSGPTRSQVPSLAFACALGYESLIASALPAQWLKPYSFFGRPVGNVAFRSVGPGHSGFRLLGVGATAPNRT